MKSPVVDDLFHEEECADGPDGYVDRRTDLTKLIMALSNFTNEFKKYLRQLYLIDQGPETVYNTSTSYLCLWSLPN